MKYNLGDKLIIKKDYTHWTKNNVYEIHSVSSYPHGMEYGMIRDDGQVGLWWEYELDDTFKSLKDIRKEKLNTINKIGGGGGESFKYLATKTIRLRWS